MRSWASCRGTLLLDSHPLPDSTTPPGREDIILLKSMRIVAQRALRVKPLRDSVCAPAGRTTMMASSAAGPGQSRGTRHSGPSLPRIQLHERRAPSMEQSFATTGPGRIAYLEGGQGVPILLIHGMPTSSYLWRRVLPLLAPRFRVFAPALMVFGDSDKPEDADLSIVAQAQYLRVLMDTVGWDSGVVVGHDIGAGSPNSCPSTTRSGYRGSSSSTRSPTTPGPFPRSSD